MTCGCGNTFVTRSTAPNGAIRTDVCSACHPFYTGKQKILDTGGRVARFEARFGKGKIAGHGRQGRQEVATCEAPVCPLGARALSLCWRR